MRQFLDSKPSYTKFTLATGKFKKLRQFARFRNEIWCMDLAFFDKLAEDNNGVKHLLGRQDLFGRTVDSKGVETKDCKQKVHAFMTMITENSKPKILRVDKRRDFCREFKKLYKAEWLRNHYKKGETKAASAEITIGFLKKVLFGYMEKKTSTCTKCLNSLQFWSREENARRTWY